MKIVIYYMKKKFKFLKNMNFYRKHAKMESIIYYGEKKIKSLKELLHVIKGF